ncbi:unnamed protein product [Closterium sp. NIES-53]
MRRQGTRGNVATGASGDFATGARVAISSLTRATGASGDFVTGARHWRQWRFRPCRTPVAILSLARATGASVLRVTARGRSGGAGPCTYVLCTGGRRGETCGLPHTTQRCFGHLTDAWRAQFPDALELSRWGDLLRQNVAIFDLDFDAILAVMYAVSDSAEGDCFLSVPPDTGIEAAALGASASAAPGTGESAPPGAGEFASLVLHLLRPCTLSLSLADPSGGPVLAHSSTVLPCPTAPSGLLSGLHLPSFSTNLVSGADLQDAWVDQFTPGGMASRTLVSGLPQSLPPLPSGPSPTCVPCVKCLQRAAPHSSEFPPTEAPLQTLHMDVWGPARVSGQGHERYFVLVVDDYSRYTIVFPLRSKGEVTEVLIDWIRGARRQLSERFGSDLPVLHLHSDRGGEFSSDLLRAFCRAEGIRKTFTLPASPHQNGIAERRIGMVMDVAPFVRDSSADKLSSRVVPCVFLGFPLDARGWQFYQPTLRRVLSSEDVTFDESVSYYRLFPYRTASLPPPPLFLAPGAARGAEPAGAGTGGAEPGVSVSEGAEPGGAEPEHVEPGFAESGSTEPGGAEPERAAPGGPPGATGAAGGAAGAGVAGGAAGAGVARGATGGTGAVGGPACVGAAGGAGAAGPGGARIGGTGDAGAGGAAGAGVVGAGANSTGGASGAGAAGGTGAGGAAGVVAGDLGAEGTGAVSAVSGGGARPRPYYVPLLQQPTSPLPGPSPYSRPTGGLTKRREPESRPVSPESRPASPESRSALPIHTVRAGRRVSRPRPPPVLGTHSMTLRPSTAPQRVPLPSPPASFLPALADPESNSLRTASPTVTRLLAAVVTDPSFESTAASALVAELVDFAAHCRLDYAASLVAESESASVCPPSAGGECALGIDVLEDTQEEFECFAAAVPHLMSMLLAPEGDSDAPDIPTLRSYAEAIEDPYSSQWQAAMDAEMAFWKSTGPYVDEVPPPGTNIVTGMWIFRVKRPPGSPPVFKARYVARGFIQRQGVDFFPTFSPTPKMTTLRVLLYVAAQRDYELHSLDFSTAFLQGSLHEEIWLRRPPGFTGSFPAGTHSRFRRPVYGLRQTPREWHDTLKMTLAAIGFAPSTADPSLFFRTDTTLPPFYVLVYVDNLVFATADMEALAHILQRFSFMYSSPQSTPLPTGHSLSAPPLDESVEPSGPYPELVGCLMYLMTCTRPDLAYPLSLLARYVAPVRWAWGSCLEDGLELSSLVTETPPGSSCEAEIYVGAMAAQELRWLTFLLTNLGEAPCSPPVLYQRGQLRLAYVASQANTADVFTKALQPCDHQPCFAFLDWSSPPATADDSSRSQWLTRDATARIAICSHLPVTECAHLGEHRTAQALYDAVLARSLPTCALATLATALPSQPRCSPSPHSPSFASAAAADVSFTEDVGAASTSAKRRNIKGKGGRGGRGGSGGGGGGSGSGGGGSGRGGGGSGGGGGGGSGGGIGGFGGGGGGSGGSGGSGGGGNGGGRSGPRRGGPGGGRGQQQQRRSET